MDRLATLLGAAGTVVALACAPCSAQEAGAGHDPTAPEAVRFAAYELVIDSGSEPLAAWQVEIADPTWQIVGVEGGAAPFAEPAYHDPAALEHGLIVLAGFTTSADVRRGAQRVAIVHVAIHDYGPAPTDVKESSTTTLKIIAAADPQGRSLRVTVTVSPMTEMP